jgi:hypothetical protein
MFLPPFDFLKPVTARASDGEIKFYTFSKPIRERELQQTLRGMLLNRCSSPSGLLPKYRVVAGGAHEEQHYDRQEGVGTAA